MWQDVICCTDSTPSFQLWEMAGQSNSIVVVINIHESLEWQEWKDKNVLRKLRACESRKSHTYNRLRSHPARNWQDPAACRKNIHLLHHLNNKLHLSERALCYDGRHTLRVLTSISMGPVLYAELLSNIRQISVIATLPTASNASTGITLAKDRKTLIITHDGLSSSLSLPALVAGTVLARPPSGKTEVSWRIPLADQARSNQQVDLTDTAIAPWAAADLSKFTSLSCKCCGTTVVQAGSVQSWRDLPSENWAEMMDFWHCHKPDHKHEGAGANETDLSTKKGYGANNRFVADIHTGLVDLTYFLLNSVDCIVKVVSNFFFLQIPKNFSSCTGYQEGDYASLVV